MTPTEISEANREAACKVVAIIGGPAEVARKLTAKVQEEDPDAKPVRIGSVWSWMHRDKSGIPISFIKMFEDLSKVPREKIRPDIPWRNFDDDGYKYIAAV